jgi:clan AA aspartic protease (TIGR02281 family)
MKKITLSGCMTKLFLGAVIVMGFIWAFSKLFPRAYDTLEAKALGIKKDTTTVVQITKSDTIPKTETTKDLKQVPNDFKLAVKLQHEDNYYLVPTKINGIPMMMTLDTGATDISISVVEYMFLKKQKLLNDSTLESGQCRIANGDTVNSYTIIINEVEVGGIKVNNIPCVVMEQQDAPLLLGMSVLKKLGDDISIDYKRNLLILKK